MAYGRSGAFGSPDSDHGVDTTETFDAGLASLEAHASFLEGMALRNRSGLGVPFVAPFPVFSMGWGE